jgi:hypothetical protein
MKSLVKKQTIYTYGLLPGCLEGLTNSYTVGAVVSILSIGLFLPMLGMWFLSHSTISAQLTISSTIVSLILFVFWTEVYRRIYKEVK